MPSHPFRDSVGHPEVADRLGVEAERVEYRQLARGVTHDTLIVEVDGEPAAVLRLAPPRPEILPRLQPAEEGDLFALLDGSGLPAPVALISDHDGSRLGSPGLLMSYLPGANTLTWERMRERCGEGAAEHAFATIVRMHELPVPAGWPQAGEGETHAERELAGNRRLQDSIPGGGPPELAAAMARLEATVPAPSGTPCIVHGDFRPANLMGAGGEVTGILDWEMATTGDPLCDFGVSTMPDWGTWMPDEELLRRYGEARGIECEPASFYWWRALGYAKVVAFVAARFAEGWRGSDLERWTTGLTTATTRLGAA